MSIEAGAIHMIVVSILGIALAIGIPVLIALRHGNGTTAPVSLMRISAIVLMILIAVLSFYIQMVAGSTESIPCESARCGGIDVHLSDTPIRFWLLYGVYWLLGFACSLVAILNLSAMFGAKRNGS